MKYFDKSNSMLNLAFPTELKLRYRNSRLYFAHVHQIGDLKVVFSKYELIGFGMSTGVWGTTSNQNLFGRPRPAPGLTINIFILENQNPQMLKLKFTTPLRVWVRHWLAAIYLPGISSPYLWPSIVNLSLSHSCQIFYTTTFVQIWKCTRKASVFDIFAILLI